jgi:hypothetical protein
MILFTAAVLAALANASTTPLRGTVIDAERKPVEGAMIWLVEQPNFGDVHVIADGRSDDRGQFTLHRPIDLADDYRIDRAPRTSSDLSIALVNRPMPKRAVSLWAFRPGMQVAVRELTRNLPDRGQLVRLVLRPPANTEIEIKDHQLRPVAGARVRVSRLTSPVSALPRPLAERTEIATDARGRAVLDAFAAMCIAEVEVTAPGLGIQRAALLSTAKGPKLIWLEPVARVAGRLTADDPRVLGGWTIWAVTVPMDKSAGPDVAFVGQAVVTTDDQGRFEIPAIAEGYLTLFCRPRGDCPYRQRGISRTLIRADRRHEIQVAVERAARVEGTVVDRQTGRAIAGVRVAMNAQPIELPAESLTNAEGRFAMQLLPAQQYQLRLTSLPPAYAMSPNAEYRQINVAAGTKPNTVDPFEIIKAEPPLRGRVVDESGQPVSGATVSGFWEQWVSNSYGVHESIATTDSSGYFQLERLPPLAEVKLSARCGARATLEPLVVWPSEATHLTLRVTPAATSALRGRVLRPDGLPIANALVRVQSRTSGGPRASLTDSVHFDGIDEIRTAADGTFQTPRELDFALNYAVEAIADGYVPESTEFVKPSAGEINVLPDLLLRRALKLRTVTGRVVDRQGSPVAGATVLQSGDGPHRSRVEADTLGRFQIGGIADGPAVLFVAKAGFRFGGKLIGAGNEAVEVVLDRVNQPPQTILKTLTWPTTRDRERELVRTLLEPIAVPSDLRQRIPADFQLRKVLGPLAWVDPPRLLAVLASPAIMRDESILDATAIALWELKGSQATEMVDGEPDPCARAYGLLALAKVMPDNDRKLRADLLIRAAREAARVADPGEKLRLLGRAADRLLEMGEDERTISVLREGWKVAQTIQRDQYAQSIAEFAPALASVDFSGAVTLVQGKEGSSPLMNNPMYANYILGEIACRIAAMKPAESEQLLTKINAATYRNGLERPLLRACSRMAPRDLDRASKLAASLGQVPQQNPDNNWNRPRKMPAAMLAVYAQLVVARAIAESHPAQARIRVEEAIAELRRRALDEPSQSGEPDPKCLIAGCMPLIERLMPDRVAEYLWLALACRAPRGNEPAIQQLQTLASLAALVARYDPTIANHIAAPVFDQVPVPSRTEVPANAWAGFENVFPALACLDPERAVDLVGHLPEDEKNAQPPQHLHAVFERGGDRRRNFGGAAHYAINRATRIQLAEALLLPIDRRRLEVLNGIVNPWLLDPAADISH